MFREASRRARLAPAAHLPWRAGRSADTPRPSWSPVVVSVPPIRRRPSRRLDVEGRGSPVLRRRPASAPRAHVRAQPGPGARRAQEVGEVRDEHVDDRVARASDVSSPSSGCPNPPNPAVPPPPRRSSDHRVPELASFPLRSQKPLRPRSLRDGDKSPPHAHPRVPPPLGLRHRGFGQVSRQGWLPGAAARRNGCPWTRGKTAARRNTTPPTQPCKYAPASDTDATSSRLSPDRTSGNFRRQSRRRSSSSSSVHLRRRVPRADARPSRGRARSPPRATARVRPVPSSSSVSG